MRLFGALLLLGCTAPLFSQTSVDMVLRVERQQSADDSRCIVIYSDASYHAERMHGSKTDVFEGSLDSARLTQVKDFAAGPLKQVQHEHMATARYIDSPDLLSIDVDRGQDIQQIRFANKADRKSYDAQLNPVLQWFEVTMKSPGARSSAKADRCVPEKKTTTTFVSGIPEKPASGPENPYHLPNLLLLFVTERYERSANSFGEKECTLVRNDGSLYAYALQRDTMARTTRIASCTASSPRNN